MPEPKKIRPLPLQLPFQTPGEEIANSILHGLGMFLAIAGLVLLTLRNLGYFGGNISSGPAIALYVIFSATMISMFLSSTLYHAIQHEGAKRVFRILDHSSAYLLIAGTYTPFCLLAIGGAWGWTYFGIEWAIAITGIVLNAVNRKLLVKIELYVYLTMGWAIIAGVWLLYSRIPRLSFLLLLGGGIIYTMGTIWSRRMHRRGSHVIWHCHIISGSVLHWLSLWFMS